MCFVKAKTAIYYYHGPKHCTIYLTNFLETEDNQIRQTMAKVRASISDGDVEGVSLALSEIKSLEEVQDEYILQLEIENMLLQNKTGELSQEMFASSQAPSNN